VLHLLQRGTSIFTIISQRLVILTSECRVLGEGAITTYIKRLKFDAADTITTSCILSESTTTRLPQPVKTYSEGIIRLYWVKNILYILQTYGEVIIRLYWVRNIFCIDSKLMVRTTSDCIESRILCMSSKGMVGTSSDCIERKIFCVDSKLMLRTTSDCVEWRIFCIDSKLWRGHHQIVLSEEYSL
jgi:hypothetical protein